MRSRYSFLWVSLAFCMCTLRTFFFICQHFDSLTSWKEGTNRLAVIEMEKLHNWTYVVNVHSRLISQYVINAFVYLMCGWMCRPLQKLYKCYLIKNINSYPVEDLGSVAGLNPSVTTLACFVVIFCLSVLHLKCKKNKFKKQQQQQNKRTLLHLNNK